MIDLLGRDLHLNGQCIGVRHDQHDLLTLADHAADRMHGKLMNHSALRRTDVDALQLVHGRGLAFGQLGKL